MNFSKTLHDDTTALQAMLDRKGSVTVPGGEYTISDTLVIRDNTRLVLSADTVIRLADNACCFMLKNELCGKEGINHRITVEGGIWDGNNSGQKRGKPIESKPYFMGVVMRFEGVEDLTVRDLTVKDPETYAMQILNADRFTVVNITFDYNMLRPNMDGVHVQGKARNGYIRNIKGATNDDLVALNCDDGCDDGKKLTVSQGDIENIVVDGVYADNGYTAVRLLSCGSVMRNVTVRNIFGTYRFNGVSFTHHDIVPGAPVWFDGISLENIFCSKHPQTPPVDRRFIDSVDGAYGKGVHDQAVRTAPIIWFAKGVSCGNISISEVHRIEEAVTEAPTIKLDDMVSVERLVLCNITQRFVNCPETPLIVNNGKIQKIISY